MRCILIDAHLSDVDQRVFIEGVRVWEPDPPDRGDLTFGLGPPREPQGYRGGRGMFYTFLTLSLGVCAALWCGVRVIKELLSCVSWG